MRERSSDKSNNYVPRDYEDLYLHYIVGEGKQSLCKMLIRSFLPYLDEDERENLAHDVFLRCFEKDMLSKFDPTKANFGGVIFFVTRTVCVNYLDRRGRNPLSGLKAGTLVAEVTEENFEPGTYSLDTLFNAPTPDIVKKIDVQRKVESILSFAKERAADPKNKRDKSLLPLLNLLLEERDAKECGAALGVTPSTIYNWISYLRQVTA